MDTMQVIRTFHDAFNRHDIDAIMALMTDDCVFENTSPAPDGERYQGQAAVRGMWERLFAASPNAYFKIEDIFAARDRGVIRWRYDWGSGHVRGVDVLTVRGGKVAEKLSYVKG